MASGLSFTEGWVCISSMKRVKPALPFMYCSENWASLRMGEMKVDTYREKVTRST